MVNLSVLFSFAAKVDLDKELVRHFLIETTKKGVRLKGYKDEPVFGMLWLNTTHLFDRFFAANCSLFINVRTSLFVRAYELRTKCLAGDGTNSLPRAAFTTFLDVIIIRFVCLFREFGGFRLSTFYHAFGITNQTDHAFSR